MRSALRRPIAPAEHIRPPRFARALLHQAASIANPEPDRAAIARRAYAARAGPYAPSRSALHVRNAKFNLNRAVQRTLKQLQRFPP